MFTFSFITRYFPLELYGATFLTWLLWMALPQPDITTAMGPINVGWFVVFFIVLSLLATLRAVSKMPEQETWWEGLSNPYGVSQFADTGMKIELPELSDADMASVLDRLEAQRVDGGQPEAVDIWREQEILMRMSGQRMPMRPVITKEGALYIALIAEEFGETVMGVVEGLAPHFKEDEDEDAGAVDAREFLADLDTFSECLKVTALKLRTHIADGPVFADGRNYYVPDEIELKIFDGLTDVAVVIAGAGLAMGFPAREGYKAVAVSNHSKANPDTGLIDKDPSGKWIKGENYEAPDLSAVLNDQIERMSAL